MSENKEVSTELVLREKRLQMTNEFAEAVSLEAESLDKYEL